MAEEVKLMKEIQDTKPKKYMDEVKKIPETDIINELKTE